MEFSIYDLTSFTQWIDSSLRASMSPGWAVAIEMIIIGLAILIFFALVGLFLVIRREKGMCPHAEPAGSEQGWPRGYVPDGC